MRIRDIGEFGLIDRIAAVTGAAAGTVVGIGDDTAVLDMGGDRLLLATVDIQVEGRHFIRSRTAPYELGRRTAAINLSDVGAMGGTPRWALVSLALPPELEVAWVEDLYRGLRDELGGFGAAVVGGNLSGSEAIVLDLTLLGDVPREHVMRRGGAQPGDHVLVTGHLGASAAGRFALDAGLDVSDLAVAAVVAAHRRPVPRVREGQAIAGAGCASAMIDLSDGLAGDVLHITRASDVGVRIDLEQLPIAPQTREIARRLDLDPLHLAVAGGEDYELLLTAQPGKVEQAKERVRAVAGVSLTSIGVVQEAAGGCVFARGETTTPIEVEGWDHFRLAPES
jgi:thiamine-monophosphate kinase